MNDSLADLIALNDEIAALSRAGVPLPRAMREQSRSLPRRLQEVTDKIGAQLEQGVSLEDAIASGQHGAPPFYTAMVRAGIRSGNLPAALEALSDALRRGVELRRIVGTALLYPLTVALLAYGLFVWTLVSVMPALADTYVVQLHEHDTLPALLARWGEASSAWLPWAPIPLLALLGWLWLRSGRATTANAANRQWLPTWGRLRQLSQQANFLHILSLLVDREVPVPDALVLAGEVNGDKRLQRETRDLAGRLTKGEHLRNPDQYCIVTPVTVWLLGGGAGRSLADFLRLSAQSYLRAAQRMAARMTHTIPLLMVVGLGGSATVAYTPVRDVSLALVPERPGGDHRYTLVQTINHFPGAAVQRNKDQAIDLAEQIAALAEAGLPLSVGLRAAAAEAVGRRRRQMLESLSERLERGEQIEEVLADETGNSTRFLVGLVRVGVGTGRLAEVLASACAQERWTHELRRDLFGVLIYPLAALAAAAAVTLFVVFGVVPEMRALYHDFETALPPETEALLALSGVGPWSVLGLACGLFASAVALRWLLGARRWAMICQELPLFGRPAYWVGVGEMSRMCGLLVDEGVPLDHALRWTADSVRRADVAANCRRLADGVAAGQTLSVQLVESGSLPTTLAPLVQLGEQNGTLGKSLREAADWFAQRVALRLALLRIVLPPMVFLFVATMILFCVWSLFRPLMSLIQNLA